MAKTFVRFFFDHPLSTQASPTSPSNTHLAADKVMATSNISTTDSGSMPNKKIVSKLQNMQPALKLPGPSLINNGIVTTKTN